jgi:hypothetical protein
MTRVSGFQLTPVIPHRLTRDATLAELTSLEQLMSVMMSQGVVEDDVIAKLWQVYSTLSARSVKAVPSHPGVRGGG